MVVGAVRRVTLLFGTVVALCSAQHVVGDDVELQSPFPRRLLGLDDVKKAAGKAGDAASEAGEAATNVASDVASDVVGAAEDVANSDAAKTVKGKAGEAWDNVKNSEVAQNAARKAGRAWGVTRKAIQDSNILDNFGELRKMLEKATEDEDNENMLSKKQQKQAKELWAKVRNLDFGQLTEADVELVKIIVKKYLKRLLQWFVIRAKLTINFIKEQGFDDMDQETRDSTLEVIGDYESDNVLEVELSAAVKTKFKNGTPLNEDEKVTVFKAVAEAEVYIKIKEELKDEDIDVSEQEELHEKVKKDEPLTSEEKDKVVKTVETQEADDGDNEVEEEEKDDLAGAKGKIQNDEALDKKDRKAILKALELEMKLKLVQKTKKKPARIVGGSLEFDLVPPQTFESVNTQEGKKAIIKMIRDAVGRPLRKKWISLEMSEGCRTRKDKDDDNRDDKDVRDGKKKKGWHSHHAHGECGCNGNRRRREDPSRRLLDNDEDNDEFERRLSAPERMLKKKAKKKCRKNDEDDDDGKDGCVKRAKLPPPTCERKGGIVVVKVQYTVKIPATEVETSKQLVLLLQKDDTFKAKFKLSLENSEWSAKFTFVNYEKPSEAKADLSDELEEALNNTKEAAESVTLAADNDCPTFSLELKANFKASLTYIANTEDDDFSSEEKDLAVELSASLTAGGCDNKMWKRLKKLVRKAKKKLKEAEKMLEDEDGKEYAEVEKVIVKAGVSGKLELNAIQIKTVEDAIEQVEGSPEEKAEEEEVVQSMKDEEQLDKAKKKRLRIALKSAIRVSVARTEKKRADRAAERVSSLSVCLLSGDELKDFKEALDDAIEASGCRKLTEDQCTDLKEGRDLLMDDSLEDKCSSLADYHDSVMKKVVRRLKRKADREQRAHKHKTAKVLFNVQMKFKGIMNLSPEDKKTIKDAVTKVKECKAMQSEEIALDTALAHLMASDEESELDAIDADTLETAVEEAQGCEIAEQEDLEPATVKWKFKFKLSADLTVSSLQKENNHVFRDAVTDVLQSAGDITKEMIKVEPSSRRRLEDDSGDGQEAEATVTIPGSANMGDTDEYVSQVTEYVDDSTVQQTIDNHLEVNAGTVDDPPSGSGSVPEDDSVPEDETGSTGSTAQSTSDGAAVGGSERGTRLNTLVFFAFVFGLQRPL